jgi:glyoxylase-like metal-dependent hydrolase (beta-lactamase superfamily II)
MNPESALAFLRQITAIHVREAELTHRHPDYARGVADFAERYAVYLEALRDDPESDRAVAA